MVVASVDKDLSKVWEVKTLGKEQDAVARKLLEDAAKQVEPIMQKRKWQVPVLSEFCPRDGRLLGLNVDGGKKIMVRVRRPGRESEFFPYESVLGTLLHELTHNECVPHDGKFYKLLDEITTECEHLMAKGISGTGEGFDAPGKRLGGFQHNPAPTALRKAALAAAEKRARTGALMPSGPRRLGGDGSLMKELSPVQAAAMAAERRQKDDVWCAGAAAAAAATGATGVRGGGGGTVGLEDVQEMVDGAEVQGEGAEDKEGKHGKEEEEEEALPWDVSMGKSGASSMAAASAADRRRRKGKGIASVQDGEEGKVEGGFYPLGRLPEESDWQGSSGRKWWSSAQARSSADDLPGTSQQPQQQQQPEQQLSDDMWECRMCTLVNPALANVCGACGSVMHGQGRQTWTCSKCTLRNCESVTKCEACGAPGWRHSTSFNPETAIIVRASSVGGGGSASPAAVVGAAVVGAAVVGASKASSPLGDSRTWTCGQCTLENTVLLSCCEACDTWRFSHGPPVASRGPAGT